ncbi:Hypothetical predicted protein [Octopus vulgaris]|uniref:Nodule Cysteine-Rich (NCR) secreted peptide n=1 Tax=Octopus vulgaris TaxID=6645 RepID=A0AA36FHU1_OCTVU|nr:Hypothetical predicted protein [Octopus vulgaris]
MPTGNVIVFYFGILLIPSIKQIFTLSQCDITKGDCVAYTRGSYYCRTKVNCYRKPDIRNKSLKLCYAIFKYLFTTFVEGKWAL